MRPLVFLRTRYNRYSAAAVMGAALGARAAAAFAMHAEDTEGIAALGIPPGARPVFLVSYMTPHRADTRRVVAGLRALHPDALVIAGGAHPTGAPEDALASGADHVVVGAAEGAFPRVVDALAAGEPLPRVIPGACDAAAFEASTGHAPPLNLFAPIEISRGCPCRCRYCMAPALAGGSMIHRSPAAVERIARLAVAAGRTRTWIVSSNALAYGAPGGAGTNPAALVDLLERLRRAGLAEIYFGSFPSEVNPERLDDTTAAALAGRVANRTLTIGGQSGSDAVLRRMGRPHDAAAIPAACAVARRHGFIPHVDILLGTPGESAAEREETFRLVERVLEEYEGRIHFHYFMPLPGTPWADALPEPLDERAFAFVGGVVRAGRGDGWFTEQLGFLERSRA